MSDENVVGRDEFQRMLRDAEDGRFDCLLVWEIDRFGRERQDIPTGKMTLKRAGVKPHIDLLQYQRKRTALACSSAVQMVELRGVEPLGRKLIRVAASWLLEFLLTFCCQNSRPSAD